MLSPQMTLLIFYIPGVARLEDKEIWKGPAVGAS